MVAEFSPKVDLSKVSKAVKQFVADVAKKDGNKKKVDSEREIALLGQYLAGNGFNMNNDEIGYIQGFMIEYQQNQVKKFEDEYVTENTKDEVSKIAKRMGDKKNIDTDEEAQALATMLKNTHNNLNAADITYIKNLLLVSGYGNYLNPDTKPITVVNVTINNPEESAKSEAEPEQCEAIPNKQGETNINNESKPVYDKHGKKTPVYKVPANKKPVLKEVIRAKKEADRAERQADRAEKEADRSQAEADRAKKEADRAENAANKPKVNEAARAKGFSLADRIIKQLSRTVADNYIIKDALSEVNSENAYSFIGKFIDTAHKGVNESVFGIKDFFDKLTFNDTVHVMSMLLRQAEKLKLQDTPEYKDLEFVVKSANKKLQYKANADPEDYEIQEADAAIRALYNQMSKVYQ